MPQYGFGSGALWGIKDGATPTPVRFGALQDCSLDFASNIKPLFGSDQLPVAQARGTMNVTGKATFCRITGRALSDLFFDTSMSTGQIIAKDSESGTVPSASGPYTITVSNSATWTLDLGVYYADTGIPLTRGATASGAGIYSVAAGVYTFNASDADKAVKISYVYTTTGGDKITIPNNPMGDASTFKAVLSVRYESNLMNITLNSCIANKLTISTSLEDYTKQDFEFGAFVDASNVLGTISIAEAS